MEPIYVFDAPVKPSGSTLLGESIVDTLLALLIGLVLTLVIVVPIVALNFRAIGRAFNPPLAYVQTFRCSAMPPTDGPLQRWAASQPGIKAVKVTRKGALVTFECNIPSRDAPNRRYRRQLWATGCGVRTLSATMLNSIPPGSSPTSRQIH